MSNLKEHKLNRVFDYHGPCGVIPNALNFNFLQSYLDNDFHQGRSIDSFIKKYE